MGLDLDWLARFLASIIRRKTREWPVGESRLDREAKRIELGCLAIVFVLIAALLFWLWQE